MNARLTGLLVPAPHVVPEKKAKKKASPPVGGENKRKASPMEEAEGSKKGRTLPPDYSTNADDSEEEWPPRAKPLATS